MSRGDYSAEEGAFVPVQGGTGVADKRPTWPGIFATNCDRCGRFMSQGAPGASWSRTWSHDMSGCPELDDPVFRCAPCTARHGVGWTNCAPNFPGNGVNPMTPAASPTRHGHEGEAVVTHNSPQQEGVKR